MLKESAAKNGSTLTSFGINLN